MCRCPANKMFFHSADFTFHSSVRHLPYSPNTTKKIHTLITYTITYPLPTPLSSLLGAGCVRLSVPPTPHPLSLRFPCSSATGGQDVPTPSAQNKCYKLPPPLLSWCRLTAPAFQPRREAAPERPDSVSRWPLLRIGHNREEHCIFPDALGRRTKELPQSYSLPLVPPPNPGINPFTSMFVGQPLAGRLHHGEIPDTYVVKDVKGGTSSYRLPWWH